MLSFHGNNFFFRVPHAMRTFSLNHRLNLGRRGAQGRWLHSHRDQKPGVCGSRQYSLVLAVALRGELGVHAPRGSPLESIIFAPGDAAVAQEKKGHAVRILVHRIVFRSLGAKVHVPTVVVKGGTVLVAGNLTEDIALLVMCSSRVV